MPLGFDIDPNLCTECLRCTAACSLVKLGWVQPALARIRIQRQWPELPCIQVCRFDDCRDQPCIDSCPVEAISRTPEGFVLIDRDTCTGCRACVEVCPYRAIWMDEAGNGEDFAYKCDYCGGSPACVPECVTGALVQKGGS
jgi:Fe-S-cluster-containing dehydrogenase component